MSHFSVLVIGPDHEAQLAPYHEYECTGRDDEYVIDVDVTDKVAEEFDKSVKAVKLADGAWLSRWDDRLYTKQPSDEMGRRLGRKAFDLPLGAVEIELSGNDARGVGLGYATMDDAARGYYGSDVRIRDGQYFNHTNPNKRWDWYQVGGRWTGSLLLLPKARGIVGRPGLMTSDAAPGYADQAMKGDIDFTQMRNDAEVKARVLWEDTRRITGGSAWETWDDTLIRFCGPEEKRDRSKIDLAREEYHSQPALELLKASGKEVYSWEVDDHLTLDMDKYLERGRQRACAHFAFVRDGKWTERGKMGWFGMSSDEVSDGQWLRMFNDMLDEIPDDTLLTVVDCHI